MLLWDYSYLVIPALILALYAQFKVKSTYRRYAAVAASSRLTGAEVARQLLISGGAADVRIEKIAGALTDHYDPRKKALRLSSAVYDDSSLAALGIAAHESGHALQHHDHYAPLQLRSAIYPISSLGSTLAFPLFLIGIIFRTSGLGILTDIGLLVYTGAVFFTVLTLPVEFNASRRAVALLGERGFLSQGELVGARRVLSAAALTYVASTAMAAVQLLQLFLIRQSRD